MNNGLEKDESSRDVRMEVGLIYRLRLFGEREEVVTEGQRKVLCQPYMQVKNGASEAGACRQRPIIGTRFWRQAPLVG
jgi:hypothetical protein